ncbi:MAG: DUF3047 domain-containing protein [Nitrospirota bacterium]|nr:MAG: DUF3047 domain-containing protein [Nitrospirota bacterium]
MCIAILAMMIPSGYADTIVIDDFEDGLNPAWERKDFRGHVDYTVESFEKGNVLKAYSQSSASGLIFRRSYELKDYPMLSWEWKVSNIYIKGDARVKSGDDYPARIYVIFPHWFKPLTKSINYIWSSRLPIGEYLPNAYHSGTVMIAVESGDDNTGRWVSESRNVYEDYKMVFGKEPTKVGAIAIMTDSDDTGETATAFYDNIKISGF